jgi:hypothetical protein
MKPSGLVITSSQANDLENIRSLNPDFLLVLLEKPTDLKCLENLSKLENMRTIPILKVMSQNATLLAQMCIQALTILKSSSVYLMIYNDVAANLDYSAYLNTFLNKVYLLFPDTLYVVCGAASQFLKKNSGVQITLNTIEKLLLPYKLGVMLSDSQDSMHILENHDFVNFTESNDDIEFMLMQINKDKAWDIAPILAFDKRVIFWTIYSYKQYNIVEAAASNPAHKSVKPVAMIVPMRDRISIWEFKNLQGSAIGKISRTDPNKYLVAIYGLAVGELVGGGFVDLKHFEVVYL